MGVCIWWVPLSEEIYGVKAFYLLYISIPHVFVFGYGLYLHFYLHLMGIFCVSEGICGVKAFDLLCILFPPLAWM